MVPEESRGDREIEIWRQEGMEGYQGHATRGLLPSRSVVIHDEALCSSKDAQHQRWHRHFTKVLNILSQFDTEVMESVTQRQVSGNLADEPTPAEVAKALGKLKNGKAAGTSNILPKMLKVGAKSEDFVCMLTDLPSAMWEERRVPQEWVDAILIPIPKKGNLHCCNNWRGA